MGFCCELNFIEYYWGRASIRLIFEAILIPLLSGQYGDLRIAARGGRCHISRNINKFLYSNAWTNQESDVCVYTIS